MMQVDKRKVPAFRFFALFWESYGLDAIIAEIDDSGDPVCVAEYFAGEDF